MMLSVVIPVRDGAGTLGACLHALGASERRADEVIVVDDGSTDESAAIAARHGARVVTVPGGPRGPAAARNRGMAVAVGDLLVFVDSDVVVRPDALALVERRLAENPATAGVFGAYDDVPLGRGVATRYKQLLHCWVHHCGAREAFTFWAGLGAIRRAALAAVGGFDESYRRPSIEDIELGGRLRRAGFRLLLCPEIQGGHLKTWTLARLVLTDIRDRAVPWTRLLARGGRLPADLNLGWRHRCSAAAAWGSVLAGSALAGRALAGIGALGLGAAALLFLNLPFWRFVRQRSSRRATLAAFALHWLYLLYSSATFTVVWVGSRLARTPRGGRWRGGSDGSDRSD